MNLTTEQIERLQQMADQNDGHCDRCGRVIQIYKYAVNKPVALMLRAMAEQVKASGENKVNFDDIPGAYSLKTQRTKMRLHGLIAHYKEDGQNVPNTWVITKRGWTWLHGDPIRAKVVVFDNQVLGHEGGQVFMRTLMHSSYDPKAPKFKAVKIKPPEAETYKDVRQPQKGLAVAALFRGSKYSYFDKGEVYVLQVDRLQTGQPIAIHYQGTDLTYKDIAAFQKDWQIVKETV